MLSNFNKTLEKVNGFESENVKILYYDLPQNYRDEYRSYEYVRFCTILDGQKNVTMNDHSKLTYSKDNFLLLAPNTKVQMEIGKNTKALVFELNDDLIYKVLDNIDPTQELRSSVDLNSSFFLGDNKFNIYQDINNIFNTYRSGEKHSEFLVDLYAQKLIFELAKSKSALSILHENSTSPVGLAVRYINQNLESKININHLAKELNMSVSNFSHCFKKAMGVTPINYINSKKIEYSIFLLRTESVTDVALCLGYDNISHFIKLFKDKYGVTPKQYKLEKYK